MANIKINDVYQRVQYSATTNQTQFPVPFPFFQNSYVFVWLNGVEMQMGGGAGQYTIIGAGSPSGGTVTFITPLVANDIVTIEGKMPIDRTSIYSPTISNLTGSDLNTDFNREVVMMKQIETVQDLLQLRYAPWALVSQDVDVTVDRYIPQLLKNQVWAMNGTRTEIIGYNVPEGGGLAPSDATYLIQTANPDLPNAQIMGALASGFVVNTTTTGIQLTREFEDTTNQIVITNQDGQAGNPAWSLAPNVILPGVEGMGLIRGTTAQRPVTPGSNTFFRFNTDDEYLEYWDGTNWIQLIEDAGVLIINGTANQIDVDSTDPHEPILSLSATMDLPGTFAIQGSTVIDGIINDDTLATATATNLATALAIKTYIDNKDIGVETIVGTTNQIDVDSTDHNNPVLSLSATLDAPGTFTIQASTAVDEIINDDTMATASATNIPTALSVKDYVDGLDAGSIKSVTGTNNEIDVDNTNPQTPVLALSATIDAPGTFTIQGSTAVDEIINDDTMATANATNLATALSIKNYVDGLVSGDVQSVTGTTDQIDVDNTDPQNPILSLPAALIAPGTVRAGNLLLDTNTISSMDTNGDINITPDGTGKIVLDSLNWPTSDGSNGYFLQTDGAGNLSWATGGGGGSGTVNSGTSNQLAYYATTGTAVSGLTSANSSVLVTDASGVPSLSTTLPASLNIPTPNINDPNGNPLLRWANTGSPQGWLQIHNSGFQPGISAIGSATNLELAFSSKGSGAFNFFQPSSAGAFMTFSAAGGAGISSFKFPISGTADYTFPNASGTIALTSQIPAGITWVSVSGTTQAVAVNTGYIINNVAATTVVLPATAAVGSRVIVKGVGAGGWIVSANSGQTIRYGAVATGVGGSMTSDLGTDSVQLTCIVANTTWSVDYAVSSGLNLV